MIRSQNLQMLTRLQTTHTLQNHVEWNDCAVGYTPSIANPGNNHSIESDTVTNGKSLTLAEYSLQFANSL